MMANRIWQNWHKWKPIRDKILRRDNYTCQFCGISLKQLQVKFGRRTRLLIVHHITPEHRPDNNINEAENLVTLCYSCHYESAAIGGQISEYLNRRKLKAKGHIIFME